MESFEEQDRYNFIFNQIVESSDDFVGSMAYVLYKQNKIEHIEKEKIEKGSLPTFDELREWQKGECTPLKLANYKKLAEQKTNAFINNLQGKKEQELSEKKVNLDKREAIIQSKEKQIKMREESVAKREKKVTEDEEKIKARERKVSNLEREVKRRDECCHVKSSSSRGFMWGVAQSFVASLLFIIFGYFFIIYLNKETDVVKELNKNMQETVFTNQVDSIYQSNKVNPK